MRGKKPSRGKDYCSQLLEKLFLHSHSWWGLLTHHFRANFNNWIQLMPLCSFSDCPFSVCFSQEFYSDWWIFAGFQGTCGKQALFRTGSSGLCSGTLTGQNAGFGAWQFGLSWHESFALSVDSWMSLDNSFDDHWNWVAMVSAPSLSWLTISICVSCPLCSVWHLCWGKNPGLGNLLDLKAEYLPQKSDLGLLMPYNL